jgi:hypothetical protein
VYLYKLVVPLTLSCDYSMNVVPNIIALSDVANLSAAGAYAGLCAVGLFAARRARSQADDALVR